MRPPQRNIQIVAGNDAPVNSLPGMQTFGKNTSRVFSTLHGNAITFSDVDANGGVERITLSSADGTLTLATLAGLTGSGNGTGSLTYDGTVAALNAAMDGLTFTPTLNFTGNTTISVISNDLGNTGTGGNLIDSDSVQIKVVNPVDLKISEIFYRPPASTATNQYVELRSSSGGLSIPNNVYLVGIEGHQPFNVGEVHDVFNLNGMMTGSNGHLAILPSANLYTLPTDVTDPTGNYVQQGPQSPGFGNSLTIGSTVGHSSDGTFTSIESANPITFFLIQADTAPIPGDDIDTNDDGYTDGSIFNNWTILDSVGIGNFLTQSTDYVYGAINFIDTVGSTTALTGLSVPTNFTAAWVGRTSPTSSGSGVNDWLAARVQGDTPTWEISDFKASLPGFAGLPLDHIAGPNFPGVLANPVVDLNGPLDGRDSLASFVAGAGAVPIFSSAAAVTDFDSANLTSLTVTITNLLDGASEVLAASTAGTSISASYGGGVLTLSGSDTLAHYQQVMRSVTYNDSLSGGSINRSIRDLTVVASDGVNSSLVSNGQVGIYTNNFSARLNEIDVDPPGGADNPYEYIELRGTPNSALTDMYVVAFESQFVFGNPGDPGVGEMGTAVRSEPYRADIRLERVADHQGGHRGIHAAIGHHGGDDG